MTFGIQRPAGSVVSSRLAAQVHGPRSSDLCGPKAREVVSQRSSRRLGPCTAHRSSCPGQAGKAVVRSADHGGPTCRKEGRKKVGTGRSMIARRSQMDAVWLQEGSQLLVIILCTDLAGPKTAVQTWCVRGPPTYDLAGLGQLWAKNRFRSFILLSTTLLLPLLLPLDHVEEFAFAPAVEHLVFYNE